MVKVKNRKRNLAETTAKKRDQRTKKILNPFEIHINKEKQKVLGRKNKADRGLPGTARAKAIMKRKGTLLQEYKIKDKDNIFLDKRLGEKNLTMTQEEKAMARFTAERVKAHKRKNIFNLNDDEVLTHRGQTLAEIEKFDDPRSDDDEFSDGEREAGKLNKKFVGEAHFGGGILSKPDTPMSRKDLIEQLIAESKKRKAEKQKIREETIDLTEKLDSGWKDLLPIIAASKNKLEHQEKKVKADDYDITLRELKFEARGMPSDRLKSEEEIALAEKERLEALEADRLARMRGALDGPRTCVKHKSADDLDDDFVMESIEEGTVANGEDNLEADLQRLDHVKNDSVKTSNSDSEDSDLDSLKHSSDNEREESDFKNRDNKLTNFGDNIVTADMKNKGINRLKDGLTEEQSRGTDNEKQAVSLNVKVQKEGTEVDTRNTEIKEKKNPYDNIPVLKISDDANEVGRRKVQSHKTICNETVNKTKSMREPESKGLPEVNLEEEEFETNSQSNENSEDEDISEEDNLSDLKASESSSDDDESTDVMNVKSSDNLMQSKNIFKESEEFRSEPILEVMREKEEKFERFPDERRTEKIASAVSNENKVMRQIREELPYTYKIPESFEQLQELLRDRNHCYQSVIVERIIKCNHQSLDEGNKEKLANLFVYLLRHLDDCATSSSGDGILKCFKVFDRLSPYLYDLAHVNPASTRVCLLKIVKEKYERFARNKKRYPGLDTLILFKLVSLLFPTSDFRHPVVTPVLTFMTEILLRCRGKSRSAISKGLFVSTLILEYTLLSKRFAPSVINFLRGVVHMATPKPSIQIIKTIPPFKSTGESSNMLIMDENQADLTVDLIKAHMFARDVIEEELNDNFKLRAFLTAVNLLVEFKGQLESLEAAYFIFQPIIKLLKMNSLDKYPKVVKKHVKGVYKNLKCLKNKKMEYMVLEKKRPKPLRLYEPRIEVVHDGRKHKPMSKERAEKEKLLHKYKREFKSAIREIRKDRAFLAKVQIKQQLKSDEERKRKVKEIFGEAALQQSELNRIKRKKGD